MNLYIFNPENDLALADGNANYCPPPSARAIANDLASLPLWYASPADAVVMPSGSAWDAFYSSLREKFDVPFPFSPEMLYSTDCCVPWGWSAQMRRRLSAMGFPDSCLPSLAAIDAVRSLSNRRTASVVMQALRDAGIDVPFIPRYFCEETDVARFVGSMPRSVIKAPWSGSGKGIAWGIGRVEVPVEHFYKGVIRRQGGVVCEPFLDKAVDFAMEFCFADDRLSFAGYSLFLCDGGAYSGNILASDTAIENFLATYLPVETLQAVKRELGRILSGLLQGSGYSGFLGVDMMIYRDASVFRLNPCVEINFRMNMGAVSRIFYDRFVVEGKCGIFHVAHYKSDGEALAFYRKSLDVNPLHLQDGRIADGYINLSPVCETNRYAAYAIIVDATPSSLYGMHR